jgi:transcriptional regulator with XRE-family HTH domain
MGASQPLGLRKARFEAGITQAELATRARVRKATISDIERGTHRPTYDMASRLAEALGLLVGDVFGWSGIWPGTGPSGAFSRRARARRGMTQAEWAAQAGVGVDVVRRFESGMHLPRPENLKALADALGVRPRDLLPDGDPDEAVA